MIGYAIKNFLSYISRPYSKNLVAVIVLHATIKAHTPHPTILFKSTNEEANASITKGRRL